MKHGSKIVLAALVAGSLATAATAFAHGGDRMGPGAQNAEACPMRMAMQEQGAHGMGPSGRGMMQPRGMGHGMGHGGMGAQAAPKPEAAPGSEGTHKH